METEEDNVLHDTPARALTFIDRLPLEDGCEGYVIQGRCANFAFQGRDDVVSVFLMPSALILWLIHMESQRERQRLLCVRQMTTERPITNTIPDRSGGRQKTMTCA